jgi:multidrug efflux system outer membrane protein
MHKRLLLIPGLALLAGCTLAPHYERPAAPVAANWPQSGAVGGTKAVDTGWRDFFADRRLQALIALALENNRDLRVAVLRVEQSRAQYRIQRSYLLPSIDATGSGTRQRTPADVSLTGQATTTSQYSVSAGVTSFELDLFGRVQSLKNQALEQYLATDEARRATQLTLVAEVATQYFTERAYAEQLALARQTLEAVQASYDLTVRRNEAGTTSELDLRTAEAQRQQAIANVAVYERQRAQAENALVELVGQPLPAGLPAAETLDRQSLLAGLAPGLPSELLQNRPDIRQAEHTLKAANANIGAARAAFFPSITLTASGGTSSAELSGLFKANSGAWSFAPQVSLPLFAAGRNRANLDVAQLDRRIEVAQYEKAIQTAFREVADALVAQVPLDAQIAAQQAQVAAERERQRLTDLRYQNGTDSYLTVLLAQQDFYSARQSLIEGQLLRLTNAINLYKALGGGLDKTAPGTAAMASRAAAASPGA